MVWAKEDVGYSTFFFFVSLFHTMRRRAGPPKNKKATRSTKRIILMIVPELIVMVRSPDSLCIPCSENSNNFKNNKYYSKTCSGVYRFRKAVVPKECSSIGISTTGHTG